MTRAPRVRAVLALLLCLTMLVGGGLRAAAQGAPASCGTAAGSGGGECCAPAECRCGQDAGGSGSCTCAADPAPRAPEAPVPPGPRLPETAPEVGPLPVPVPEDPPASRARTPRHGLGAHAASRSLQILLRTFLL
ncbi:MAG: hypothetical protein IT458_14755 [Planctomycetes bacterium]|nr:hypothetical protein [Planctomycetota bacterium]